MTSPRVLGVVAAVACFLLALWALIPTPDPASPAKAEPGREETSGAAGGAFGGVRSAPGAVGAREASAAAPTYTVSATVVDEDNNPVEEGTVSLRCLADDTVTHIAGGTATLGIGGEFTSLGCKGRVCAELHHPALVRDGPWTLEPGRRAVLRARALARLEGRVVDPAGVPVAGARVVAVPGVDPDPRAVPAFLNTATTTDEEGTFFFVRIERPPCDLCGEVDGRCGDEEPRQVWAEARITARAPGFVTTEVTIEPDREDGDELVLTLGPPGPPLTVTVLGGDEPQGVYLLARSLERGYEVHRADLSGREGMFGSLGPGEYEVRALRDGAEIARGVAAAGQVLQLRVP